MKNVKEKSANLIPLLEGTVIEATVLDGGHSLFLYEGWGNQIKSIYKSRNIRTLIKTFNAGEKYRKQNLILPATIDASKSSCERHPEHDTHAESLFF